MSSDETAEAVSRALPPRSSDVATGTRWWSRWRPRGEWRRLLLCVVGVWVGSRLAVLLAGLTGAWVLQSDPSAPRGLSVLWGGWDTVWYVDIARGGYFQPDNAGEPFACCTHAFFPGLPLTLRAVRWVIPSWIPAGLTISAVAGAVAVVALARLARYEVGPRADERQRLEVGCRAVLYLVLSPYALFLFAVYTEALFLAFALPSWLAAKRGDWRAAGLLVAGASTVRITGLFLAAALVVEYAVSRRRAGLPLVRPAVLWLVTPAIPAGAYVTFLYTKTGSWLAWQEAQASTLGFGRAFSSPVHAFRMTFGSAFHPATVPGYAFARRAELVAMAVGLVLIVVLVRLRRWGETLFIALNVLAFGTAGIYFAIPRGTLVWFPLWLLLARLSVTRWRWLHPVYLWTSVPLMVVLTVAYTKGFWVN